MAFPLAPQIVEDLKSNFYWSYVSQNGDIESTNLEISVDDFLNYIELDLEGIVPYSEDELITLYYGMKPFVLEPSDRYFTYMIVNSERNNLGVIVNLGIIGYSDKYLLLSEGGNHIAIQNTDFEDNTIMYTDAFIFSPYINESTIIGEFTNHPLSCSFPKEQFRQLILENWDEINTSLSDLKLVFEMGASYISPLSVNYKVETVIITTKDNLGVRLDDIIYPDMPFKCKAMDVGALCPPSCGN